MTRETLAAQRPVPPVEAQAQDIEVNRLTDGRSIARNAVWSLLGRAAPLALALVSIPLLLHGLGADKYGVFNLGWVIASYLNLFDFGLGQALTLNVSGSLAAKKHHDIAPAFWKSLLLLFLLGAVGGLVGILASRWLIFSVLAIPAEIQREAFLLFVLLSLYLPIQVASSALRGLLEAHQRFRLLASFHLVSGTFYYLVPIALLPFTHNLMLIVGVVLVGRLIEWAILFAYCVAMLPRPRRFKLREGPPLSSLLRLGGWMTVNNVLSPLMDFADRFLIGALLTVGAVAYYGAPFDLAIKLMIIPTAISSVIFPAFAASYGLARHRAWEIYSRLIRFTFICLLPVTALLILFAPELLRVWLGAEFAAESTRVFQILVIGMLAKCLAQTPVALLQGGGRPDTYAQLHLVEFPLYAVVVWFLVSSYGIEGAALAWTGRVLVDAALLLWLSHRMIGRQLAPRNVVIFAGSLALLTGFMLPAPVAVKVVIGAIALVSFGGIALSRLTTLDERSFIRSGIDAYMPRGRWRPLNRRRFPA